MNMVLKQNATKMQLKFKTIVKTLKKLTWLGNMKVFLNFQKIYLEN